MRREVLEALVVALAAFAVAFAVIVVAVMLHGQARAEQAERATFAEVREPRYEPPAEPEAEPEAEPDEQAAYDEGWHEPEHYEQVYGYDEPAYDYTPAVYDYQASAYDYQPGDGLTKSGGVNYHDGRTETYYSSAVLHHYRTDEWTADEEGFYRDSEGRYVVAASDMEQGAVFEGSKGECVVLDTGCAPGVTDYYVDGSWA